MKKPSFTLAFCLPLLLAVGCGTDKPSSEQANPPLSEQASPLSPAPSAPSAPSSTFTPKELPVLGTLNGQRSDAEKVWNVILSGKSPDEIPQASSAGVKPNPIAVKMGYPPKGTDVCKLPYSALILVMYQKCFSQGMTPVDVANIVGWEGTEVANTRLTKSYEWADGKGGSMVIVFEGDRLKSKSQSGLKP